MKNSIRISSIIVLIAIYCFTIGNLAKPLVHSENQATKKEQCFSTIPITISAHTSQSESAVNNLNNFPAPSFKNLLDGLGTVSKTTEQSYKTAFSQYSCFFKNILIRHRKADIIFPFHYFW